MSTFTADIIISNAVCGFSTKLRSDVATEISYAERYPVVAVKSHIVNILYAQ